MNARSTRWFNDAASDLALRNAYQATAEADCKKAHPMASKVSGIARKPYTNCVNQKMSDYDGSVGAEQAAKAQATEDARQLTLATKQTDNATRMLSAQTETATAQAQVATVQASADADTAKAAQMKIVIIAGASLAALVLIGVIVMAVKGGSSSTATATSK